MKKSKRRQNSRKTKKNKIARKNISRNKSMLQRGGGNIDILIDGIIISIEGNIEDLFNDVDKMINELYKNFGIIHQPPPVMRGGMNNCVKRIGNSTGSVFGSKIGEAGAQSVVNRITGTRPQSDSAFKSGFINGLKSSFTGTFKAKLEKLLGEREIIQTVNLNIEMVIAATRIKIRNKILEKFNDMLRILRENLTEQKFKEINPVFDVDRQGELQV
jgi:hypothetical protein